MNRNHFLISTIFSLIILLFCLSDINAQNIFKLNNTLTFKSSNFENQFKDLNNGLQYNLNHSNSRDKVKMYLSRKKSLYTAGYDDYKYWDSEKHFWIASSEIAILEFIPWALAKWIRNWDNPEDNWANVSSETWWRNISHGWEYDGDAFQTNNFSHPYHGALYFNAGRTNGYDFWESSAWALTGSAVWEMFGETFRPAYNDWIYTGIGGSNLGEILYRLSTLVTDNRATGSDRVVSEVFGTLINPVRGFNRAITGEMGKNFDNPKWSRPEDFLISFDSGIRTVDLNGIKSFRDKDVQGLFGFNLNYGNRFTAKKPFDYFTVRAAISSSSPNFTELTSTGYLFGWALKNKKHYLGTTLDFTYNNIAPTLTEDTDSITFKGVLYGAAIFHPHLISIFPLSSKTNFITQVGINGVLMGATPNDYFLDEEGRNYDYGPGIGLRIIIVIKRGIWDYMKFMYFTNWIWTQTEPSSSKHNIHYIWIEGQYPITKYFSFGAGLGTYWRSSLYENYENINRSHPVFRIFFKTAIIDL